ncbi:hypothetical protein SAMN05421858_1851 [Haladaptatus litoreus]|uniref:Hsp20/alpha crystallin family protein n=1 Tax=Haladaptatus litoreus TaxID=553468 RepID=A0A1N6Z3J7_9EURY|nr:hypothetical protein [Haladaptatus litoreus]SIR21359.1 hypothetical protein SAMN05421858_1851 [Haladaptatus litoreus]
MALERITQQSGSISRRYSYDDGDVVVADFGTADVSVDVLEDVAIVVVEDGDDEFQTEIDLPTGGAEVLINNGILTIMEER